MKKRYLFVVAVLMLFVMPIFVKATSASDSSQKKDDFDMDKAVIVDQKVKYLRTVNEYANVERDSYGNIINADVLSTETYEMTKEEWDQTDFSNNEIITRDYTIVENAYKMMITTLYENEGTYRYMNELLWVTFPSVRSYDVIGIGHDNDVGPDGTPTFQLEYVTASNQHLYGMFWFLQSFSTGDSATFILPLENLNSLEVTYYYDVKKVDPNSTIYSQSIYGDYIHGIDDTLTFTEAKNHDVNGSIGIVPDSSAFYKFDAIDEADVYWNGVW